MYCTICGQQHDTTACPPSPPIDWICPPLTAGEMTINGMTPFEHALIERLDKLIALVQTRPTRNAGPDQRRE